MAYTARSSTLSSKRHMKGHRFITAGLSGCLVLAATAGTLRAQDVNFRRVQGDSALKSEIGAQTRVIYDQDGDWLFLLTRQNPLGVDDAYATELQAKRLDGRFGRIVATAWAPDGKYSVEYYFDQDGLIFVYETFEYFEESAPSGSWRNFKGAAAWERHSYVDGMSVGYGEVVGRAELLSDARSFIAAVNRLRVLLEQRGS